MTDRTTVRNLLVQIAECLALAKRAQMPDPITTALLIASLHTAATFNAMLGGPARDMDEALRHARGEGEQ